LTVIAMLHRDRIKLPDRRAELYHEAVEVLLGKWDEAKALIPETPILQDAPFDTGDKRLMLQALALHMHERGIKEIDAGALEEFLTVAFARHVPDFGEAQRTAARFLHVIKERTGLLIERGEGLFAFSHLTFQEYLTALVLSERADFIDYSLGKINDVWESWQEVILLEAGALSLRDKEKTTTFIRAIADYKTEKELYQNLMLAARCLRDVGPNRVIGNLQDELQKRLRLQLDQRLPTHRFAAVQTILSRGKTPEAITKQRIAAAQALSAIGDTRFWRMPFGEPEWVHVPAGPFTMGGERFDQEKPIHTVDVPEFWISRVPITNAQYKLFADAMEYKTPGHWDGGQIPKRLDSHPVVNVSWHDALAYCRWLSDVLRKPVTLPSEAEWEKAARGMQDAREYPWGDEFDATKCNTWELGLRQTTPVGIFSNGASPYGCLDMVGNVWEWTRSEYRPYPYVPEDGRENTDSKESRVLRGGSWGDNDDDARCAYRSRSRPDDRFDLIGFRVCVGSAPVSTLGSL